MTATRKRDIINAFFKQPEIIKLMTEQPNGYIQTIRDKLKEQHRYDISTSNVYQRVKHSGVPQRPSKHETMNAFFAQPDIVKLMTVKPKGYAQTIADTFKKQNGYDISPSNVYQRVNRFDKSSRIITDEEVREDRENDSSAEEQSTNDSSAEEQSTNTITISVTFNGQRYDNVSLDTLNKIQQLLQNEK